MDRYSKIALVSFVLLLAVTLLLMFVIGRQFVPKDKPLAEAMAIAQVELPGPEHNRLLAGIKTRLKDRPAWDRFVEMHGVRLHKWPGPRETP